MLMYNFDSDREDYDVPSHWSPIVLIPYAPLPIHVEEVVSLPVMEKGSFEGNSVIVSEDHASNYNIEEIFGAFTFNLCRKKFIQKRVRKVKKNDGTMEEMQEDEVLFEKNDKDLW